MQVQVKPPMAVTNAVSWRSEGIKYKKNEVSLLLQAREVATPPCLQGAGAPSQVSELI